MRPTDQTTFGDKQGNCFAACIASVLELPLEDVPNFCVVYPDTWYDELNAWLHERGMFAMGFSAPTAEFFREHMRDAWCIVSGPAARGCDHATVWRNGALQHDPHPSRAGIISAKDVIVFGLLDPAVEVRRG